MTKDGFYSAVKSKTIRPDQVMVRARRPDDLKRLLAAINSDARVITTLKADYRYRVIIPTESWALYLAKAAREIDYSNFKDASCAGDKDRHDAYMDCWVALLGLQFDYLKRRKFTGYK